MSLLLWVPDDDFRDAFGASDVPGEVKSLLMIGPSASSSAPSAAAAAAAAAAASKIGRGCKGRTTGWARHSGSGVPYRLTVVAPAVAKGAAVTPRVMQAATEAFLKIIDAVDDQAVRTGRRGPWGPPAAAPAPQRPSSLDLVILMWGGRKAVPAAGRRVDPQHVNTGMCTRYSGGRTHVLIYRKEEAVKTLAHEMLHVYRVADWCNEDADVLRGSSEIARACLGAAPSDARLPRALKPCEAVVDFLAIDLCRRVFGGASDEAVADRARVAARRLAAHFRTLGSSQQLQSTPAVEYYVVKLHLLSRAAEMRKAHARGLQKPDKQAVRRVFLAPPPVEAFRAGLLPRRPAGMSLRMTPSSLTETPEALRGGAAGRT